MKNRQAKEAIKRFTFLCNGKVSEKEMGVQFAYLIGNKHHKKSILDRYKDFKPLRLSKMASKMVRTGRLC